MKVRRVGLGPPYALAEEIVSHRDWSSTNLAKSTHQTTLPEELVEEILLRVPLDEPAHLVRATLVCKAWHRILSDDTFRCRYRRFHGTPPLLGYICSHYSDSTVRFVSTTSVAAASSFKLDDSSGRKPTALDCRHGRVLIETDDSSVLRQNRQLIVWDTITGSQQHLSLPTYPQYPYRYNYVGAVLCAKHDGCDHLDCHGGPFLVVLVGMSYDNDDEQDGQTWASVYSSETGAWSSPTTPNDETNLFIDYTKTGLLIRDALYFISGGYNIIKYDFCKHELSAIHLPESFPSILIKGNDGGLGVAATLCKHICMWSWQVGNNGVGEWMIYRVMDLDDTLLPKGDNLLDLICMVEGTSTVFIGLEHTGVFTLDLNSREVRKIGEAKTYYQRPILPYMCFHTPKY